MSFANSIPEHSTHDAIRAQTGGFKLYLGKVEKILFLIDACGCHCHIDREVYDSTILRIWSMFDTHGVIRK